MRINDLEYKTGLDRATIRYYEKEGMITPVRRDNGYRDYSDEDLQQLLKIKLLRQLGMSLSKIKELQQGSADFQTALKEQIHALEVKRDRAQRSAQVCRQMQTDGVTYTSLNANYYLNQFRTTQAIYPQNTIAPIKPSAIFQESVPREYHPFRHYFARLLDLEILAIFIQFIQVVFFRTRLETFALPYILLLLLWIPLEALCYALFSTTPGKFAFGIRVDHADGTKHSFVSAIKRAFGAYRYGMGWGIPFWQLWRQYKSYKNLKENWELEWNDDSEITYYSFCRWQDICKPLIVFTAFIAMTVSTFLMLNTPKHSGYELSLQQFVENYNDYLSQSSYSSYIALNQDGTFMESGSGQGNVVVVVGNGRLEQEYSDLEYIMDNNTVRGFTCTDSFTYRSMVTVFQDQYKIAIKALLAAQPGENANSADSFLNDLMDAVRDAVYSGKNSVLYENEKIIVQWQISCDEGCKFGELGNDLMLYDPSDSDSSAAKVYIHVELKAQ